MTLARAVASGMSSALAHSIASAAATPVVYDDATEALVARFSTPPTTQRKGEIDALIVALKAAGVWTKLDALYVLAAADEQAGTRNWIADAYNASAVNTPTFEADRGATGNGSNAYYDTSFNPTTAVSPKFTLNSACLFSWSRTNLANGAGVSGDMGAFNSSILRHATLSGTAQGRPNNATTTSIANSAYPGLASWSRTAAGAWAGYAQGAAGFSGSQATTALTNASLRLLSSGGAFSVNQIAAQGFGAALTSDEMAALFAALQTYLQAVGAA